MLYDFPPRVKKGREYPQSKCYGCANRFVKQRRKNLTEEERLKRNEMNLARMRKSGEIKGGVDTSPSRRDPKLFLEWLKRHPKAVITDADRKAIERVKDHGQVNIDISVIDRVMTASGEPDQVHVLYP